MIMRLCFGIVLLGAAITIFADQENHAEVLLPQNLFFEGAARRDTGRSLETLLEEWYPDSNTPMSNISDSCNAIMHHFALQGGNFTKCMLDNARPFRMCESCVEHYVRFTYLYDALQNDEQCSQLLLLADRVQLVTSAYKNFKTVWANAYCDKCYDSVEINSTTGEVTRNFTADTQLLQGMQANVSLCFFNRSNDIPMNPNVTEESVVCTACRKVYQQMNSKYKELKDINGGQMCMDLVDMMNYTRLMWSSHFNCSQPMPSPVSVILISVIACVTVFIFYIIRPFTANIRRPHIFKAKRMATGHSRYGSLHQEEAERSLPRMATSPTQSMEARRRDSHRAVDGNGVSRTIEGTG